jgi:glutaredoxin
VRTVTIYVRPGCHLCEEALGLLYALQGELAFQVRQVNIQEDAALLERYDWFIPVIEVEGREVMRAPVDAARLRSALRERLAGR